MISRTVVNPAGLITPNFKWPEFFCRCYDCIMPVEVEERLELIVTEILQPIRSWSGRAVHINSAWRCEKHNKAIGGVPNSMHMKGAVDFTVRGLDPRFVYKLLDGHLKICHCGPGGLGSYASFTHVDLRDTDNPIGVRWWVK